MLAELRPPRRGDGLAAERRGGGAHAGFGARHAHEQLAVVPRAGTDRQRLSGPAVEKLERARLRRLETARGLRRRRRRELERDLGDHAERAERAGHQARHVVAGDVLHHAAAEGERLAAPVEKLHAEHKVAQRAGACAAGAREASRDAAAERGGGAEMRRLERQALAVRLQCALKLGERRAAARRHDQLGRLVIDDAGVAARVEHLAARRVAVEILGAAAAQAQGAAERRSFANRLGEGFDQKRASSGCGSTPRCTRMRPYSAQRASVGMALPGLSRPSGSKARFTPWKSSSSPAPNCTHIWFTFSTPTPCSPVIVPPTATHFSSTSAAKSSVRCSSSALFASKRMSGCRLPSPAWNTFGQRKPYFFSISPMKASTSPRRLRGMVPSMQ